jgi:hypothetical protein
MWGSVLIESCDPKGSVQQCIRVLDFMATVPWHGRLFLVRRVAAAITDILGHGAWLALALSIA